MSIEIGDGGLGYIYLGDVLIAGGGGGEKNYKLLYCPLTSDTLDHSGNNISLTSSGTISYSTLSSGKKVASFNAAQVYTGSNFISTYLSTHTYTVNYWINVTKGTNFRKNHFVIGTGTVWSSSIEVGATALETNGGGYTQLYCNNNTYGSTSHTGWVNVCVVVSGGTANMYVNGASYTSGSVLTKTDGWLGIGYAGGGSSSDRLTGNMSEFIVENKARTATEISKYFNQTKSNYGL